MFEVLSRCQFDIVQNRSRAGSVSDSVAQSIVFRAQPASTRDRSSNGLQRTFAPFITEGAQHVENNVRRDGGRTFLISVHASRGRGRPASLEARNCEITQVTRVQGTIVDVAVGNPAFSTLVTALQAADLVTTLQGKGPFTVFAPTNDAFAKIPPALLNFLLANPEELSSVLLYHVTPGIKDLRFQFVPRDLVTAQGQDVYADREEDTLFINNSKVLGRVIRTDNGVIYVIDSVLLPQYR